MPGIVEHFLQGGKQSMESLRPSFNLTDNLKNQNHCLGHSECLSSWFNFPGIVLWLLIKCFILKNLVSSKQGFSSWDSASDKRHFH